MGEPDLVFSVFLKLDGFIKSKLCKRSVIPAKAEFSRFGFCWMADQIGHEAAAAFYGPNTIGRIEPNTTKKNPLPTVMGFSILSLGVSPF